MTFAQKIDFNTMMKPVAIRLLGEPAQKHGQEWRYGNRGSLAVDIKKGTWFDHEANIGGGVFDLIRRQGHEQPAAWLRSEGFLGAPRIITDRRIVETFDYCDENGTLLFQVVRFEPKNFRQRRPDGRGGWKIDFNTMMKPVAIRLLGEPAQKHGQEWRYGNRGRH
jgi:putative DNA primase/helicase